SVAELSDLGRARRWSEALGVLLARSPPGFEPRLASQWAPVIVACSASSEWQAALAVFCSSRQKGVLPSLLMLNSTLGGIAAGSSSWQLALHWLQESDQPAPNVVSFNSVSAALARGLQWGQCLALLSLQARSRVALDVISFNTAMSSLGGAGQWQLALSMLGQLKASLVQPDAVSYGSAIAACGRGSVRERSLQLLGEMRHLRITGQVSTYNAAVAAFARGQLWQSALWLVASQMRWARLSPDLVSYTSLARAASGGQGGRRENNMNQARLVQADRPLSAAVILAQMRSQGLEPNVFTYNAALAAATQVGRTEDVLWLSAEMRQQGLSPDGPLTPTGPAVAAAALSEGWAAALSVLAGLPEAGAAAMGVAARSCAWAMQWASALHLAWKMPRRRRAAEGPGLVAFLAAQSACQTAGHWPQLWLLLGVALRRGLAAAASDEAGLAIAVQELLRSCPKTAAGEGRAARVLQRLQICVRWCF
ncbi:unnamed protein product, partial [Polarella glacialis]